MHIVRNGKKNPIERDKEHGVKVCDGNRYMKVGWEEVGVFRDPEVYIGVGRGTCFNVCGPYRADPKNRTVRNKYGVQFQYSQERLFKRVRKMGGDHGE